MPDRPMAEEPPEKRYDETVDPENPPNAILHPDVRRTAVRTYLGIIVATFVLVAAGLVYWTIRDEGVAPDEEPAIGTAGEGELVPRGETPGGFEARPEFDSTRDELEYRGAGEPPRGPMPGLMAPLTTLDNLAGETASLAGRRVELSGVEVERAEGDTFWIRGGDRSVAVVSAGRMPAVRGGQRIDLQGTMEPRGDEVTIRATRIVVD